MPDLARLQRPRSLQLVHSNIQRTISDKEMCFLWGVAAGVSVGAGDAWLGAAAAAEVPATCTQ